MTTLHQKYRPDSFDTIIGQGHLLGSLKDALKEKRSHAFLFSGPSGCGKTTLARICANNLGCSDADIREVDGATTAGVDAMRDLQNAMRYKPIGGGKARAAIIDEAHRVTKQAWDTLLKIIEEPPPHLYWFLCTTAPEKLQATVRNRCMPFVVKPLSDRDMLAFLTNVAKLEDFATNQDILITCASEAGGSPRQGLVNLSLCSGVKTRREARALLQRLDESDPIKDLCRFIVQGGSWQKAMALVDKLQEENPEGIRIVVCNYLAACLRRATSDKEAVGFLGKLEAFKAPYNESEKFAPLVLSLGQVLFSGE